MSADFKFFQPVKTPKGRAVFISYMIGGHEAQVARPVPATQFAREDCERRTARVAQMSNEEFKAWQKSAEFEINEVYPVDELSSV